MIPMTPQKSREWMLFHWNADEDGTDLDVDKLDEAHRAIIGSYPSEEEDAFGNMKNLLRPSLTDEEAAEIEAQANTNQPKS